MSSIDRLYELFQQWCNLTPQPDNCPDEPFGMYSELTLYTDGQGRIDYPQEPSITWATIEEAVAKLERAILLLRRFGYDENTSYNMPVEKGQIPV